MPLELGWWGHVWDFFSDRLRTIYLTRCCSVLKSLSDKDLVQRTKVFGIPRQKVSLIGRISHDKVLFQFHQAYYNFGKQRALTAKERQKKKKKLRTRNSSRSCPHQKIRSRPWHFGGWRGHHHAACNIDCGSPSLSLCLGIGAELRCREPSAFSSLHHLSMQGRQKSLAPRLLEQWCPLSAFVVTQFYHAMKRSTDF